MSHPPRQSPVEFASTHLAPWMHHLHPLPLRQKAQLYWAAQSLVPVVVVGALHWSVVTAQSAGWHWPAAGPLASPDKHELLVLHQPHPALAMHEPQSGVRVAQPVWGAGGAPPCWGGAVLGPPVPLGGGGVVTLFPGAAGMVGGAVVLFAAGCGEP